MERVSFVDVLRLLALLQMVNGHTLDAVLDDSARSAPGFATYNFVRGLVSVAFMVLAGISFQLTTLARFEAHRASPEAVRRRLVRALQLIAVGYALQLRRPITYLDPATFEAALQASLRCEVLQCIGAALLVLELVTLWAPSRRAVLGFAGLASATLFALAPLGERFSQGSGAVSFLRAVTGHGQGSQFPLLPWAGYVFAGVWLGALALPERGRTSLTRQSLGLALSGLALEGLSSLLHRLSGLEPEVRVASAPWFVLHKLAVIAGLLALLSLACARLRGLPRPLLVLGGETLAIFVFHLLVLFSCRWSPGVLHYHALPWHEALRISLLNIALSAGFGLAWHALKARAGQLRGSAGDAVRRWWQLARKKAQPVA